MDFCVMRAAVSSTDVIFLTCSFVIEEVGAFHPSDDRVTQRGSSVWTVSRERKSWHLRLLQTVLSSLVLFFLDAFRLKPPALPIRSSHGLLISPSPQRCIDFRPSAETYSTSISPLMVLPPVAFRRRRRMMNRWTISESDECEERENTKVTQ